MYTKYGASTNMVGVEYHEGFQIFAPFVREEIPRTEFTYDVAVKKIIELNDKYNFDYIYIDAGHGEMQIEQLKLYGQQHPHTGLHRKIVRVNFSEKVTVRDPVTKVKEKKDIKPFMVNNTVLLFERGQFAFNPNDKTMIKQFEDYHIERFGINGRPIYSEENEHIHDCIILAIHGFTMKYNEMFKIRHASVIAKIDAFRKAKENVIGRDLDNQPEKKPELPGTPGVTMAALKFIGMPTTRRSGRSNSMPRRKTF